MESTITQIAPQAQRTAQKCILATEKLSLKMGAVTKMKRKWCFQAKPQFSVNCMEAIWRPQRVGWRWYEGCLSEAKGVKPVTGQRELVLLETWEFTESIKWCSQLLWTKQKKFLTLHCQGTALGNKQLHRNVVSQMKNQRLDRISRSRGCNYLYCMQSLFSVCGSYW